jgi:hypothetical protein
MTPERDPIREAHAQWRAHGWDEAADGMAMVTSLARAHQLQMERIESVLRPYGLTFARYEVLRLLSFTRSQSMPMTRLGSLLQVHPTSVTSAVDRAPGAHRHRVQPVRRPRRLDQHHAADHAEPGCEVIHLGHNRSVQEVVDAAVEEDVQGVAVSSSYQGGHVEYFEYLVELCARPGPATSRSSAVAAASSSPRRSPAARAGSRSSAPRTASGSACPG